jgi:hypothetical protein
MVCSAHTELLVEAHEQAVIVRHIRRAVQGTEGTADTVVAAAFAPQWESSESPTDLSIEWVRYLVNDRVRVRFAAHAAFRHTGTRCEPQRYSSSQSVCWPGRIV